MVCNSQCPKSNKHVDHVDSSIHWHQQNQLFDRAFWAKHTCQGHHSSQLRPHDQEANNSRKDVVSTTLTASVTYSRAESMTNKLLPKKHSQSYTVPITPLREYLWGSSLYCRFSSEQYFLTNRCNSKNTKTPAPSTHVTENPGSFQLRSAGGAMNGARYAAFSYRNEELREPFRIPKILGIALLLP